MKKRKLCRICNKNASIHNRTLCNACIYKQKKERYPIKLAYWSLKGHAKERGKVFELTYEQFKNFCIKSKYISLKGIKGDSYHIDRINERGGYTIDNIQCITNIENVKKYIRFSHIDEYTNKKIFYTSKVKDYSQDEELKKQCPF